VAVDRKTWLEDDFDKKSTARGALVIPSPSRMATEPIWLAMPAWIGDRLNLG